ncbi:hypothetical protein GCM10029978_035850 [Actinoallomurus acanthiterrae]
MLRVLPVRDAAVLGGDHLTLVLRLLPLVLGLTLVLRLALRCASGVLLGLGIGIAH